MSNTQFRPFTIIAASFCLAVMLSGCSGNNNYTTSTPPLPPAAISITPSSTTLDVGQTQQFAAQLINTPNPSVTWQVNGVAGGNAGVGSIDTNGFYTAPTTLPNPPNPLVVTVTAVSNSDSSLAANSAVTISTAPAIVVSITPRQPTVQVGTTQQFMATVTNSPGNQAITWEVNGIVGGNSTYGTVSTSGLYQAPAAIGFNSSLVGVTARSQADNTKTASALVTLSTSVPPVSVTVDPTAANLMTGQSQNFFASVSPGSVSPNVTWSLSGPSCPNACGTISNMGVYTAPSSLSAQGITVTATATSVADPSKSGSSTITVSQQPPIVVLIAPNPLSINASVIGTTPNSGLIQVALIGVPTGTIPILTWQMGCISIDEDGDECFDNDNPLDDDGPGTISNPSGTCSSNTCMVSGPDTAITYTAPSITGSSTVRANECGAGLSGHYAVVPLSLTVTAGPQVITTEPGSLCIWVQSSIVQP
jgi:uncharacterized protein YjdB